MDISNIHKELFKPYIYEKYKIVCDIFDLEPVSEDKFKDMVLSQHMKGMAKYNQTIDECPHDKYNWSEMATEEIIDCMVYSIKKKDKR